ncbi:MAG: LysM peptidoglycan-binding domain-containing protein [Cryobacterium sp.]|nr:LysM peptidoglycan-binding domain-containing protein [Oligoflexia bacterium]
MDKKLTYFIALMIAALSTMTLTGCSSSEVSEGSDVTADELPVVDANTDQLPNTLDQPTDGSAVASADGLAPEASVDVPTSTEAPSSFADASTAPPTSTEPPANSPSVDAPPSMNESAPVATATERHSTGSGGETYEVLSGDTLMKIAFKVYGDVYQWRKVLDENSDRISNPAHLVKGTQLKVDNAANENYYNGYERYLIKSGDTLGLISDDVYGTKKKWKDLWKMNDGLVKDPNRIYAGFFLRYSMSDADRQESERLKSMHSAPLAESGGEDAARNPSSFEEAKVPGTPTTVRQ